MIYAGFWRRFAALLIDGLILLIPSLLMARLVPYVGGCLVVFLYRPFFESSVIMGTPGKIFMGIQVTTEAGARLSFQQALLRWLLSILSGLFMGLGYLFNLFTPKRQTFHDLVTATVVLQRPVSAEIDWVGVWLQEFRRVFNISPGSREVEPTDVPSTPSTSETSAPPHSSAEAMSALDQLHKLYQQGALTEEEYRLKKDELLRRI